MTHLAAVHERIRVLPQVVKAAAQAPQVLLANRRRNSRRRKQNSP